MINYFVSLALKSSRGVRSIKYTLHTIQHKQVACMRRKMLFTIFKYLFLFQRIIKVLKYANYPRDDVIHSTKFWSKLIWWKKDISANLDQKCLILCSKILLKCAPQFELNNFIPMATYWVPAPPILKAFLATFGIQFHICKWCLMYMIE